jgi:hypothetical protein
MPTNEQTLGSFIQYFNAGSIANIKAQFCNDDPAANPQVPCVGITDHGPAFFLQQGVDDLFTQLLRTTFKNLTWVSYPPHLTWPGGGAYQYAEIGVQSTFTGTYKGNWFPSGGPHGSSPLSNLQNYAHYGHHLGKKRGNADGLPAFAVFTFDGANKIRQLQMYLDRYALMQSITENKGEWDAPGGN